MLVFLYIPYTLLLSAIDAYRIKKTWGKVGNINHWESYLFAVVGIVGLYFIVKPTGWHIAAFVAECVFIRGVFFSPFLNLCRRERLDYESNTTNSMIDGWHVGFWVMRLISLVAGIIVFIADKVFI